MIAKTIIVSIDLFVLRWYNSIRRENFPAKYDKRNGGGVKCTPDFLSKILYTQCDVTKK